MIQTMLYGKRFFPYYVHNILGGIEEDGERLTSGPPAQPLERS
jgi:20S proteasome subunit beta 6